MFELMVFSGFVLGRISDYLLHLQHIRALSIFDFRVLSPRLMRLFYGFDFLAPIAMFIAHIAGALEPADDGVRVIGIFLLCVGFGLRVWSIMSLGSTWVMGLLKFEGVEEHPKVGPFRLLPVPEHLARLIEVSALSLALGGGRVIPLLVLVYGLFIVRITRILKKKSQSDQSRENLQYRNL